MQINPGRDLGPNAEMQIAELLQALVARQQQAQPNPMAMLSPSGGYVDPRNRQIQESRGGVPLPKEVVDAKYPTNLLPQNQDPSLSRRIPGSPDPSLTVGHVRDIAGLLKNLSPAAQAEVMGAITTGMGPKARQLELAQERLQAYQTNATENRRLTGERDAVTRERDQANRERADLKAKQESHVSEKAAKQGLKDLWDAGERDWTRLEQEAKKMGWNFLGGVTDGGIAGFGGTWEPRIGPLVTQGGPTPTPGSTPRTPPAKGQQQGKPHAQAPQAQQGARVTVEKGGKKFSLPVGQLEQAQKQGYKLIGPAN